MSKIFEVEIQRADGSGVKSATILSLPATTFEIADALAKARITDGSKPCIVDIESSTTSYLQNYIDIEVSVGELNHLAQRIQSMSDWEMNCLKGLTMMDAAKHGDMPIAIDRLINMTHSIGDCQIASDVSTDRQLGKFYVDNVFIEKYSNLPDEIYKVLDYELIGKQARVAEGGVFTDNGYVVHNGELSQEYSAGDAATLPRTNYTIMLELSYNGRTEYPMLPADDGMLVRAIAQLGARSLQECTITVSECAVPQLAELISPSLLQEPNSLVEVNELASRLEELTAYGKLDLCRAVVETTPSDATLDDVLYLIEQLGDFQLMPNIQSPSDYGHNALSKYQICLADQLLKGLDLHSYGVSLMNENNACITDYGVLCSTIGHTVEQCLDKRRTPELMQEQGMKMSM